MHEKIHATTLIYDDYKGQDLYCDGEIENILLDIVKSEDNANYFEIINNMKSWPVMYHLSNQRENILRWYPFKPDASILEIGSGCGAVSGALYAEDRSITCVELSKKRSLINAYRHKEETLKIHVGNFEDIQLKEKYDYVTLIGVLEYSGSYVHSLHPYHDFLKKAKSFLKPDGKLLIAIENRIGLKYFAGCKEDHVNKFFEGVEGYTSTNGIRTFTRKELTHLLKEAGFENNKFYYPYPDYKFTTCIYSDDVLPSAKDLNENIRNFDLERVVLFDEKKVYDTLLDNDLFQDFSNSFLVEASLDEHSCKINYVKFSQSNRDYPFQCITSFVNQCDESYVLKEALTDTSVPHIQKMATYFDKLSILYKNTSIKITPCELYNATVKFSFVQGKTLEEILIEKFNNNDIKGIYKDISDYFEALFIPAFFGAMPTSSNVFQVFGETIDDSKQKVMEPSNLDTIFTNVKYNNGKYEIYDYEWVFDFPVPIKFIMYRNLFYFVQDIPSLNSSSLYAYFNISNENIAIYEKMEASFQNYVLNGKITDSQLYQKIASPAIPFHDVLQIYEQEKNKYYMDVYFDTGDGYQENNKQRLAVSKSASHNMLSFPLSRDIKNLRIDPMSMSGIIHIEKLFFCNTAYNICEDITYETNGVLLNDNHFLYLHDDPYIQISNIKNTENIKLFFECEYTQISENEAMMIARSMNLHTKNDIIEEDEIELCIDEAVATPTKIIIKGWVVSLKYGSVNITIDKYAKLDRIVREDINALYQLNESIQAGFYIEIKTLRYFAINFKSEEKEKSIEFRGIGLYYKRAKKMFSKLSFSLKREGLLVTAKKVAKRINGKVQMIDLSKDYEKWYLSHQASPESLALQKHFIFEYSPLISIVVPVYNTPETYFCEMVESVLQQTYGNWELILVDGFSTSEDTKKCLKNLDDERIIVKILEENKMISANTNVALNLVKGEYVALLDHDDLLTPDALYEMVKKLNTHRFDMVYSDEDKIDSGSKHVFQPHFKPEFSLDTLRSYNYITHFTLIKKEILKQAGEFDSLCDGSQDFDMFLRIVDITHNIGHVSRILYHWRVHDLSTAGDAGAKPYIMEAGKRALRKHLKRNNMEGIVEDGLFPASYRIRYPIIGNPRITILIPNKDHVKDLEICINSILEKTTYTNYEIIVIENNSVSDETFKYYDRLRENPNIKICYWDKEFNYSAINNFGIKYSDGEYVILLNNDIEVLTNDWIQEMLMYAQRSDIGVVGAKLYYPNDTIQHAGVVIGIQGVAGHVHKNYPKEHGGYMGRLKVVQNLSAVTAACLMVSKAKFNEVNGLDERFKVAFNDIDFCMKLVKAGYVGIFTPYVEMIHHESLSRGNEDTLEKKQRFQSEIILFKERWGLWQEDPYYNKNLSLTKDDYSLREINTEGNSNEII